MSSHEIAQGLDKSVQRACYEIIEKEYMIDDIKSIIGEDIDISHEKIERMAEMAIINYDANISHFDQVNELVQSNIK